MTRKLLYVLNGLRPEPAVTIRYIRSFWRGTPTAKIKTIPTEIFLQKIESGKSIIRLGDGEVMILTGRDIYFQPYHIALATTLRKMIVEYTQDGPYLLAVPLKELQTSDNQLKRAGKLRIWRLFRVYFDYVFKHSQSYADAKFFYINSSFETTIAPLIKNKHVLFVSNETVLSPALRNYADNYFAHTSYITVPATNAYAQQDVTRDAINSSLASSDVPPVIIFAAGPASKVLAYEFASRGIQSLDIGQGMKLIATSEDRSHKI